MYDFTLVDGVIAQARREGVRLILLWFGLWKNGSSSYVPAWMKTFIGDDQWLNGSGEKVSKAVLRPSPRFAGSKVM